MLNQKVILKIMGKFERSMCCMCIFCVKSKVWHYKDYCKKLLSADEHFYMMRNKRGNTEADDG